MEGAVTWQISRDELDANHASPRDTWARVAASRRITVHRAHSTAQISRRREMIVYTGCTRILSYFIFKIKNEMKLVDRRGRLIGCVDAPGAGNSFSFSIINLMKNATCAPQSECTSYDPPI